MYHDNSSAASATATTDPMTVFTKIGYPQYLSNYYGTASTTPPYNPTSFGTPPDLMGRYGIGVDYTGQPVYEAHGDWLVNTNAGLLFNSPYDLNLADSVRRDDPDPGTVTGMVAAVKSGTPVIFNDDAPYATTRISNAFSVPTTPTSARSPIDSGTWSMPSIHQVVQPWRHEQPAGQPARGRRSRRSFAIQ